MPPARGRVRGGRGKKSTRGGSQARTTRSSPRLKAAESELPAEVKSPETANEGEGPELETSMEDTGAPGSASESSAQDASVNNVENTDAGNITDSKNDLSHEAESGALQTGLGNMVKSSDLLGSLAETSAEDDDIEITTESESAVEESLSHAGDNRDAGDIDGRDLSEMELGETNQSELTGGDVDTDTSRVGEDDMDTSAQGDGMMLTDIDAGEEDYNIDDLVVIDGASEEENGAAEEHMENAEDDTAAQQTEDDTTTECLQNDTGFSNDQESQKTGVKQRASSDEQTREDEKKGSGGKLQVKKIEEDSAMSAKADSISGQVDHVWQVRVYPVRIYDLDKQKEVWAELQNMAIIAEYRLTSGMLSRGQINVEHTMYGMFQFIIKGPQLQPMMRQLMCCSYSLNQLRIEMRRVTIRTCHQFLLDAHILQQIYDVMGEVMYHKEKATADAKKDADKTRSVAVSSDVKKSSTKSTTGTKTGKFEGNLGTWETSPESDVKAEGSANDGAPKVKTKTQNADTAKGDHKMQEGSSWKYSESGASTEKAAGPENEKDKTAKELSEGQVDDTTSKVTKVKMETEHPSATKTETGVKTEKASNATSMQVNAVKCADDEAESRVIWKRGQEFIIERGDAVSFRIQLHSPRQGLKELRDGLRTKGWGDSTKVREDCQLFLKNLSNSVCDETIAAIFPFARLMGRTKGDGNVGTAVFETASRKEAEKYMDLYNKVFVNHKPAYVSTVNKDSAAEHLKPQGKTKKEPQPSEKTDKSSTQIKKSTSQVTVSNKETSAGQKRKSPGGGNAGTPNKQAKTAAAGKSTHQSAPQSSPLKKGVKAASSSHSCEVCGMKFTKRKVLISHLRRAHRDHFYKNRPHEGVKLPPTQPKPEAVKTTSSQPTAPLRPGVNSCHNCGKVGHFFRDCPQMLSGVKNQRVQCRNCLQDGHFARDCPLPQQHQTGMMRQAEEGARQLEELYARVAETQRNLSFLQQQAQMAEMRTMGEAPFPGQASAAQFGLPPAMGGNMLNAPFGPPGGYLGVPDPHFGGVSPQIAVNMGTAFGGGNFGQARIIPHNRPTQGKKWQQQRQLVYIKHK